jgi:hypothetical protein
MGASVLEISSSTLRCSQRRVSLNDQGDTQEEKVVDKAIVI